MDETQYWYTMKDVLAALKVEGLPSTWAQIKLYKDVKLIPPSRNIVLFHRADAPTTKGERKGVTISKKDMPIYTQADIQEIVDAVRKIKADEEASRQTDQEAV